MTFLIILCTILLILDCLLLGLLIIIQLPKKEAGVGLAFGGGATDALFGAGSGTALSNFTRYTAIAFFVLVFALSVLNNHLPRAGVSELKRELQKQSAMPTSSPSTAPAAGAAAIPLTISTNTISTSAAASNVPASSMTASNAPAK
jgi:protein translocase SecG subunit